MAPAPTSRFHASSRYHYHHTTATKTTAVRRCQHPLAPTGINSSSLGLKEKQQAKVNYWPSLFSLLVSRSLINRVTPPFPYFPPLCFVENMKK